MFETIFRRMEEALTYVHTSRWSTRYGLVTGATTIDWGDVQPETGWGVAINEHTKWAIDIYDNAMYAMAVRDFLSMRPAGYKPLTNWGQLAGQIKQHVRLYLWQASAQEYLPHLYLDGSPFTPGFNESVILYTGGSTCAVLAGFNTPSEISAINRQMVTAAASGSE